MLLNNRTEGEIEIIRRNSILVSKTLAEVGKIIKPGVSTIQLDKVAEEFIRSNGAEPGFLGYNGYPNTLCTSVNDQIVHGIPSKYELKEGDIVSIDCGTKMEGFYGDSAYTFAVGEVDKNIMKLMECTKESLFLGIEQAVSGKRVGDIGSAVQNHAENAGYSVVRELVGHGIGKNMHEAPEVPNYGKRGKGQKLSEGIVICIEPMINLGERYTKQEADGWTIKTVDGKPSAHYELTIVVRKGKAELLSTFDYIEEIINKRK